MLTAPTHAARPWPLTGRRTELDAAMSAVASGDVDAVLVTGDPGVGKSRLVRELIGRLESPARATA